MNKFIQIASIVGAFAAGFALTLLILCFAFQLHWVVGILLFFPAVRIGITFQELLITALGVEYALQQMMKTYGI